MMNKDVQVRQAAMNDIAGWATATTKKFPGTLAKYLKDNDFKVHVTSGELLQRYDVTFEQKIKLKANSQGQFGAHVFPMMKASQRGGATRTTFLRGDFGTVNLAHPGMAPPKAAPVPGQTDPGEARAVITAQLTGCCLVFGYDADDSNVIHMGHARQQHESEGGKVERDVLVTQFREADPMQVFEGVRLKHVEVFGGDEAGYGSGLADVLGWVSGNKFFLAVRTLQQDNRTVTFNVRKYRPIDGKKPPVKVLTFDGIAAKVKSLLHH